MALDIHAAANAGKVSGFMSGIAVTSAGKAGFFKGLDKPSQGSTMDIAE